MERRRATAEGSIILGVLLALVAFGAWQLLRDGGTHPAEAAVSDLFEARQEGDCERLVEVLSEPSWSDEGRRSRDEFIEQCSEVVEDYQPELGQVEVLSEDDEGALVLLSVRVDEEDDVSDPIDEDPAAVPPEEEDRVPGFVVDERGSFDANETPGTWAFDEGHLVLEDGEWKVEMGLGVLGVGPPLEHVAADTVVGYFAAFLDGDCERQITLLTEEAWSAGGQYEQAEFLEQCAESASARDDRRSAAEDDPGAPVGGDPSAVALPQDAEVTHEVDGSISVVAVWQGMARSEPVPLVREGGAWKLGSSFEVVRASQLASQLLDESVPVLEPGLTPVSVSSVDVARGLYRAEGSDVAQQRRAAGFMRGVSFTAEAYGADDIANRRLTVAVFEFEDPTGATEYSDLLNDRLATEASGEPWAISPVPAPGIDDAFALITDCTSRRGSEDDRPDCERASEATAVGAHEELLVAVTVFEDEYDYETDDGDEDDRGVPTDELLDETLGVLAAQVDQLPQSP